MPDHSDSLWVFAFSLVVFAVPALIVNPSRISLFKESWLHPFGPSSRLILTSQYPKLSLSSSVLSLGGLILFCSQYSFLRNSVALFILWEVWKDRNSIIHDNVKLNIVKTRQTIWKWLLDTVVLFHPAGNYQEGNKVADSLASFAHAHRDSMVFYSEDKFPTCCKKFQSCGPARTVSDLNKDAGASLPRLKCRKEASAQQTMNLWVPCLAGGELPFLGLTKAGNGSAAKEVISYPLFGLSKDREARLLSDRTDGNFGDLKYLNSGVLVRLLSAGVRDPVVVALDPGVVARPAHRVRHPAVPVPEDRFGTLSPFHKNKVRFHLSSAGATHHMTPNSTVLTSSVTPSSSISVLTASGAFVPVRQVGSVTRSSDPSGRLSLDAVYHVSSVILKFLVCRSTWVITLL
ncbi:hypothetical protein L1987_89729 [Smallanthus sonchifolius]|nr:hypothetical protein L1987_89729 [Smallanthus sonchifolius]